MASGAYDRGPLIPESFLLPLLSWARPGPSGELSHGARQLRGPVRVLGEERKQFRALLRLRLALRALREKA